MKKWILVLLASVTLTIFGLSAGEASSLVDSPFPLQSPDQSLSLTVTDLGNGVDHAIIFFNNFAGTAIAAVLDPSGNPHSALTGFSYLAADFNPPGQIWSSTVTATLMTSPYPVQAPDIVQILTAGDLNSFDHAVIYINSAAGTAMVVVLDPDGVPDSFLLGYALLAIDLKTDPLFVWGSNNGAAWYCVGGCQ